MNVEAFGKHSSVAAVNVSWCLVVYVEEIYGYLCHHFLEIIQVNNRNRERERERERERGRERR